MQNLNVQLPLWLGFIGHKLIEKPSTEFLAFMSLLMISTTAYLSISFKPIWQQFPDLIINWFQVGLFSNFYAYAILSAIIIGIKFYIGTFKKAGFKLLKRLIKRLMCK